MFSRSVRVFGAAALITVVLAAACGGSSSDSNSPSAAGHGGGGSSARAGSAGVAEAHEPLACGETTCKDIVISQANFTLPACCADADTSHCGIDSSVLAMFGPTFSVACQPLKQPGTPDANCPDSPATPVSGTPLTIKFPGCCRADHSCGYQLDYLGIYSLGLGCVDSSPFLDGGTPPSCGEMNGEAGAGAAGESGAGPGR